MEEGPTPREQKEDVEREREKNCKNRDKERILGKLKMLKVRQSAEGQEAATANPTPQDSDPRPNPTDGNFCKRKVQHQTGKYFTTGTAGAVTLSEGAPATGGSASYHGPQEARNC